MERNQSFRYIPLKSRTSSADKTFRAWTPPPVRQARADGMTGPCWKGKPMLDPEVVIKSVVDSVTEVFDMMLGVEVAYKGALTESQKSESGLIALVGITGEWGGSGIFCCGPEFANRICEFMLGSVPEKGRVAVDSEVMDVIAEVTNMIVGNVKNYLEPITGTLAISIPTVIHGRNFQFRNIAGLKGTTLSFAAGEDLFEVRFALAPAVETTLVRSKIPILGLAAL